MAKNLKADTLLAAFSIIDRQTDEMIAGLLKVAEMQAQIIGKTAAAVEIADAITGNRKDQTKAS
jgi:hypothetical protein